MAINETWKLAPWAEILYACDPEWWLLRAPPMDDFRGLRIVGNGPADGCLNANVKADQNTLLLNGPQIGAGGNGGFQALNIAIRCGAARVLLTGVDCQGAHWHPDHGEGLKNPRDETRKYWIKCFEAAAKQIARLNVEVINCSRATALECFPRMTLEDALGTQ